MPSAKSSIIGNAETWNYKFFLNAGVTAGLKLFF
jgi:hypothetical protein